MNFWFLVPLAVLAWGILHKARGGSAPSTGTAPRSRYDSPAESVAELSMDYIPVFPPGVYRFRDQAIQMGRTHNIPPALILAIIWQESRGDVWAVGDSGRSRGLMQVSFPALLDAFGYRLGSTVPPALPFDWHAYTQYEQDQFAIYTAARYQWDANRERTDSIFDPYNNLRAGTKYLQINKLLADRNPALSDKWSAALWGYNGGTDEPRKPSADNVPIAAREYAESVIQKALNGVNS